MTRRNRTARRRVARRGARDSIEGEYGEPAVLVRQTSGAYVGRNFVPGVPVELSIMVTPQPAIMSRLRDMWPEGPRPSSALEFFVAVSPSDRALRRLAPLRTGEHATEADVIRYEGIDYAVVAVSDYIEDGHIEVLAVGPDE